MLSGLKETEHCVTMIDFWEENGRVYICTELCEEGNLETYLNSNHGNNNEISEFEIWNFIADILLGLWEIHQHEILHLDLKPENILIHRKPNTKPEISDNNSNSSNNSTPYFPFSAKIGDFTSAIDLRSWSGWHSNNHNNKSQSQKNSSTSSSLNFNSNPNLNFPGKVKLNITKGYCPTAIEFKKTDPNFNIDIFALGVTLCNIFGIKENKLHKQEHFKYYENNVEPVLISGEVKMSEEMKGFVRVLLKEEEGKLESVSEMFDERFLRDFGELERILGERMRETNKNLNDFKHIQKFNFNYNNNINNKEKEINGVNNENNNNENGNIVIKIDKISEGEEEEEEEGLEEEEEEEEETRMEQDGRINEKEEEEGGEGEGMMIDLDEVLKGYEQDKSNNNSNSNGDNNSKQKLRKSFFEEDIEW
eukprot:TRINITY_DN1034_c7_g1_i1.p1 TRINITY_DN1034_c7_g1~~TRINITY_DN1034_c7_g1_i1.p1  ORF type:complete len:445 (-),score=174.40 TRINITY_DN1034_c7_g1_i1:88-1350(-)